MGQNSMKGEWKMVPFTEKKDAPVVSLCEQGDMGLFGDPLSEQDQKKLREHENNDSTEKK